MRSWVPSRERKTSTKDTAGGHSTSSPTSDAEKAGEEGQEVAAAAATEQQTQGTTRILTRNDTVLILITNAVGLGVLSLPHALRVLGLIPGLLTIIGFGILTGYTAYVFLQIYRRYPTIVNIADIGRKLGGRNLEWFFGGALVLNLCLCAASCVLTLSIALNFISGHGLCTVGFIGLATLGCLALCVPRSMKFCALMGYPATVSILGAVLVVIFAVGIRGPQGAPLGFKKEIVLFGHPSFAEGMTAVLSITFAYAGAQSFTTIMAEMTSPVTDFLPSLLALQTFNITIYVLVSTLLYFFAAQHITSPALGSAPALVAKIAYGLVLPCVLGSAIVFGNSAVKYLFVITLRAIGATKEEVERHAMTGCTLRSWVIWTAYTFSFWICAFILANSIPVFQSILAIAASVFVAWFTFLIPAWGWLHINKGVRWNGWRKRCLTVLNVAILALALTMNTSGSYAAIVGLLSVFKDKSKAINGAFTCENNGNL